MIPASAVYEAAWKILMGLLFGVLLGGFGVGLLAWAVWRWLGQRPRIAWSAKRPTMTVPKGSGEIITGLSLSAAQIDLNPVDLKRPGAIGSAGSL